MFDNNYAMLKGITIGTNVAAFLAVFLLAVGFAPFKSAIEKSDKCDVVKSCIPDGSYECPWLPKRVD